ncbi:MAG: hypothetical protein VXZ09_19575, partial [Pseudomonadota bacterium]|nr:hypothetical protein [Pseudomonadota bacterium]
MSDTIKGGQGVASRATKDQHDKEAFAAELSRGVQVTPEDQSRSTLHTGEQQEGAYIAKKNVEGADSGSGSGTNPSAASPAQSPQSSGSDPRGLAQTGQSADYQQPAAPDAPNPDSTGPSPTGGEDAMAFRTASTAPNTSAKVAPDGPEPTRSPTGGPGLDGVKTPNTDGTPPTNTGGEPAPVDPGTEPTEPATPTEPEPSEPRTPQTPEPSKPQEPEPQPGTDGAQPEPPTDTGQPPAVSGPSNTDGDGDGPDPAPYTPPPNYVPEDMDLSGNSLNENDDGAVVGTLSTNDRNGADTHTYSVSDDRFEVVDGQLQLKDGVALNHEVEDQITIDITVTDSQGAEYIETFTVEVTDTNDAVTGMDLSGTQVSENAGGAVVGTLSAQDEDVEDTHSYSVSDDRFEVVDGQLQLKDGVALNHEVEDQIDVQVTVTDAAGTSHTEGFTVEVTDTNDAVTGMDLSGTQVSENAGGAVVGTLSAQDEDAEDTHSYSVSDDRFEVVDGQLQLKDGVALNHEVEDQIDVQ